MLYFATTTKTRFNFFQMFSHFYWNTFFWAYTSHDHEWHHGQSHKPEPFTLRARNKGTKKTHEWKTAINYRTHQIYLAWIFICETKKKIVFFFTKKRGKRNGNSIRKSKMQVQWYIYVYIMHKFCFILFDAIANAMVDVDVAVAMALAIVSHHSREVVLQNKRQCLVCRSLFDKSARNISHIPLWTCYFC